MPRKYTDFAKQESIRKAIARRAKRRCSADPTPAARAKALAEMLRGWQRDGSGVILDVSALEAFLSDIAAGLCIEAEGPLLKSPDGICRVCGANRDAGENCEAGAGCSADLRPAEPPATPQDSAQQVEIALAAVREKACGGFGLGMHGANERHIIEVALQATTPRLPRQSVAPAEAAPEVAGITSDGDG